MSFSHVLIDDSNCEMSSLRDEESANAIHAENRLLEKREIDEIEMFIPFLSR